MNFLKKLLPLMVIALLWNHHSSAQQNQTPVTKANYELAARYSPRKVSKMVFSTSVDPNWFKNSDKFWYAWQTPKGRNYYIVDPSTAYKKLLFDNAKLAARLTEIVKDPFDAQNIPLQKLKLVDDKKFTFQIRGTQEVEIKDEKTGKPKKEKKLFGFEYDIATGALTEIKDFKEEKSYPGWASISPDKKYAVFSRNFNLYYMDMENLEKAKKNDEDTTIVEHQLTTEGTRDFAFGSGNRDLYVSDKDKNKRTGAYILWSPDSKHFAMLRSDDRKVKDLWIINVLAQPRPKLVNYKYHMAGESDAPVRHLVIFDIEKKEYKTIKTARFKDQELKLMAKPALHRDRDEEIKPALWLGDNETFYLYRISRDIKRVDLCAASVSSDTLKAVVEERMNTYIETRDPYFINNGEEFIHWSERDGWAHLYLYGKNGNLKNRITSGEFHVEKVITADNAAKVVYFTANGREQGENPYYAHQYRANFDGSNIKVLNPGDYTNTTSTSDNGKYFVNTYSRVDSEPAVALMDNTGKRIMELEKADLSLLFEAGYKFPERFKIKAGDGVTDLYGVMYKPFDFDSTKLYPIIEYVYPGPQTEAVNTAWAKGMNRIDRLAQFGFVVITVGNRGGAPNRSKWYHNYGYGNLRDYGLEDKKVAVERLAAKHKFIDINKVGIHGHSGGGFMSTAAMLVYPDFFKVAVSAAGNHDNSIYNRWWSEQHHGIQEIVSEKGDTTFKYNIASNPQIAKNLKGRLMLVTGDVDNNVHPGNTIRMVDALIKANKRFELVILPGESHSFRSTDEYFFWKMGDYFCRYLIGDFREEVEIPQMNNN
ncbi:MAG: DPP IV N-terminal domain-containing protein [Bacteroidales bacterium]|nr:DPP IV N-terminal domain-containing protein [Bacteroidales bacterium]MDD3990440.1 DPP IV N-terminal domain-containing protein [Bacteroidales bacterium]